MRVKKKSRHTGAKILLILVILLALVTIDSTKRVAMREYEVPFSGLPKGFDGYKIVQLSDIHGRNGADYIALVEEAKPDIIAITGDLIDDKTDLSFAFPLLTELVKIAPVYYITGNHEYDGADLSGLIEIMENTGVTFLRNDHTVLNRNGDSIILAGTDDPNGRADMKTPAELMYGIREELGNGFCVVMNHRNDKIEEFSELGAELVLSGHAHGGIIRFPFTDGLIGPGLEFLPDYTSGVYEWKNTKMVVSRGLAAHVRFMNNPEVTVIRLIKE